MTALLVAQTCQLFLIVVLVIGVKEKIRSFPVFRQSVEKLVDWTDGIDKGAIALFFSGGIVVLELALIFLMISGGRYLVIGVAGTASLVTIFTILIAIARGQKREVNCNCFGASTDAISILDVVRNIVIISVCGVYLYICNRNMAGALSESTPLRDFALFCLAIAFANYTINLKPIKSLL